MSTDAIQDFILKDQRNLHIAASVSEAWARTREHIAKTFLERLSATLLQQLPGWKFNLGEDFFEVPWQGIHFHKPSWNEDYWLSLQFVELGNRMQFGIQRDRDGLPTRPYSSEVLEAIARLQPSAKVSKPWWEAHVFMRTPAPNWREPEILWRLHSDPLFLTEVSEQMLAMAETSEPILDRFAKKKR